MIFVSSAYKPEGTSAKSFSPISLIVMTFLEQARFSDEGKAKVNLMSKVDNLLVTEGLLKGDITTSVAKNTRLSQLGEYLCYLYGRSSSMASYIGLYRKRLNSKRSNLFI